MKLITRTSILLLAISTWSSCEIPNRKDKVIFDKNSCFAQRLAALKQTPLYKQVMVAFRDTFAILKSKKEYFGVPDVVDNKIDEAMFFKKDSSECMLIVLQKSKPPNFVFAKARMVQGSLKNKRWTFEVSMSFAFERSYFQLFKENNFENISKVARYSVLTAGNATLRGCRIDDDFWFKKLQE